MFEYIEENLKKIENPKDVNVITSLKNNNEDISLVAFTTKNEQLILTEPLDWMSFPLEPMVCLKQEVGGFYMNNFAFINFRSDDPKLCVNINNFDGFHIFKDDKNYLVCSKFKEGDNVPLFSIKQKSYEKNNMAEDFKVMESQLFNAQFSEESFQDDYLDQM